MTPESPPGRRQAGQQLRVSRENGPPPSDEDGKTPEHGESGAGGEIRQVWEAQRAVLAAAFPAWKIVCVADLSIPLWFALYRHPLTPQQEAAGFRPTMLRGSAETLQAELVRRCRTIRLPLPPPAS